MPTTPEKPRFVSMTIRLESSVRDGLKALAVAKNRTVQSLMREAISNYLEVEELKLAANS
jgi:predicted transcriptional regulator